MSASVCTERADLSSFADAALNLSARFWFVVAVLGQWFFVAYVIAFYGGSAIRGNLSAWNEVVPNGHTPGATMSNVAVAVHLALAVVIMVGGPLQLMPQVRRIAPAFHRWNGRLYVTAVVLTSIVGLSMIWSRENTASIVQLGTSVHAALIVVCAAAALYYVLAGEIRTHRRWALRLFMVVNAGWFFRIGVAQWAFSSDATTRPFLSVPSFVDYVLPLAVLEIYLWTKDAAGAGGRLSMAGALFILTVMMGIGIVAAARVLWIPRM